MWSSTYYFEVTVNQISAELWPFENFGNFFFFQLISLTVYIWSTELYWSQYVYAMSYYLPWAYNASTCGDLFLSTIYSKNVTSNYNLRRQFNGGGKPG